MPARLPPADYLCDRGCSLASLCFRGHILVERMTTYLPGKLWELKCHMYTVSQQR